VSNGWNDMSWWFRLKTNGYAYQTAGPLDS